MSRFYDHLTLREQAEIHHWIADHFGSIEHDRDDAPPVVRDYLLYVDTVNEPEGGA